MSAPTSVETYFSSVASSYQKASRSGVWSGLRRREAAALMGVLGDVGDREILELGCGAGFYTRELLQRGVRSVHAVDISASMLEQLPKQRVVPILGDAALVDVGRRFDVLLSAGMLEFVESPAKALANAAKFANAGARFGILFPTRTVFGRAYRQFHRRHGFDIRLFDAKQMADLAEATGWRIEKIEAAGPYSSVALLIRKHLEPQPRRMRALFLVNGLGLGNSTRCHSIIQRLRELDVETRVITSGNGQWYFEGRADVPDIQSIEAFYYASKNGKISIPQTLLSVGEFRRIAQRNARTVERTIEEFKPDVALIDSVYTTAPFRRRGIPIVALNNADVVHKSYPRFSDKPSSIRLQFYAIEEMDYLFHRMRVDMVLSPNLDESLPGVGGNVVRIGPIVRQGYTSEPAQGPVRRVLVMLSGSRFGSKVALSGKDYPFHIDIVGREAPTGVDLPPNVVFHGRVKDNKDIVKSADLVLVNGGFSAVSETFALRKPMVVLPIANHAEQWVNARTIEKLGVGFMAKEDEIESAMTKAIENIDELREAYGRLPPVRDGAAEAASHIVDLVRRRTMA